MSHVFDRHYTRTQARQLLPLVTAWLDQLQDLSGELQKLEKRMSVPISRGEDIGGGNVNSWVRKLAEFQAILGEFHDRRIQIKDLDRGLIDFPALLGGREVFLCWEKGESDIEFWHDLDTGFAGREPL